jgi:hypothetical protein
MNKFIQYLLILILSLAFGAMAYLMSESLIFFGAVAFCFFLGLTFLVRPLFLHYAERERKRHEGYRFVNSFIISYSSNQSLEKAYAASSEYSGPELTEILKGIESKDIPARLDYLKTYFDNDLYAMFLSLFHLYEEQGGDLLTISKGLLDEITRVEEAGDASNRESLKNLRDFLLLWVFSLAIFLFLRYGLATFYSSLVKSPVYLLTIGVFFGFFLISLVIYAFRFAEAKPRLLKGPTHEKAA